MSPRPRSPKQVNWNKKLSMWRKNHRRADGSLPSLKAAMKACKGRRASTKRCRRRKSFRKHRVVSPRKMSPARVASVNRVQKKQQAPTLLSALFGSAQKKQQSPAAQKKQQKPAVFGQKAPANPMFVPGTLKKQQSPAKQQKPAQKKQQKPAQKKQQKPAQFGQKAQAKPAPAMRFA